MTLRNRYAIFSGYKLMLIVLSGIVLLFLVFVSVPKYVSNSQGCTMMLPAGYIRFLGFPWKEFPCTYKGFTWGESLVDHMKKLKCLIDKGGFCFINGSCTYIFCSARKSPNDALIKNNEARIQKFIRDGCTQYFDGCNTCNKGKDGFMCTLMACSEIKEPECLDYNPPKPYIPTGNENSSVSHDLQN